MAKKYVLLAFVLFVVAGLVYYSSLISYGLKQLQGQLKLINSAVSIDEALHANQLSQQEKDKVLLIQGVRLWADTTLGLHVGDNYTSYVRQDSSSTMWVVTAAYPFELRSYQWSYGPVGKMAYKGFFDRSLAEAEASKMKELGFDTDIGVAGGWSTLGILDDPILSGMLKRDSASLIELIIHESTHATVFHFGETRWNENVATAVGRAGMEQYLTEVLKDTSLLNSYKVKRARRNKNREFIHRQALLLSVQYDNWEASNIPLEERALKKRQILEEIKEEFLLFSGRTSWPASWELNNTFFTDYLNYHASNDSLKLVIQEEFRGDIKAFIESIK